MKTTNELSIYSVERIVDQLKSKLSAKGYNVVFIDNKSELNSFIKKCIPENKNVCLGDIKNLSELDIDTALIDNNNPLFIYSGNKINPKKADYFVSAVDAITEDGDIIYIEKDKNNQAKKFRETKNIVALAGINKITKNIEHGMWRIKNIIVPQKSREDNLGAPCQQPGFCVDCTSNNSLCNEVNIFKTKPD